MVRLLKGVLGCFALYAIYMVFTNNTTSLHGRNALPVLRQS